MITIDFETKSYSDLTKTGAWAYSEDPTTDIICVCWGIEQEPVQEWWPDKNLTSEMPQGLSQAINSGHLVEAHGVPFEYSLWVNVLAKKYGWKIPGDDYWRCTMAVARYYGLPPALDKLCRALNFEPKDPEGARLITKYSKLHLKTAKTEIPDDDFFKFVDYCVHDVRMEQSVSDWLGDLPERELPIFLLDLAVNRRGILLDQAGIDVATKIADDRSEELTEEFRELTDLGPGQRDKIMAWCAEEGVELENMQAEYLKELLDGDLAQGDVRRAIEIRLAINKASTKKLDAMSRQTGSDGRARFQTWYHGAATGRNTGTGFHPLNLNKGFQEGSDDYLKQLPSQLVADIMHGDARWLDMVYGDAMDAVAKASRHWIIAEAGKKIVAGDYSSIEAVILACLAGEQWKIDVFKAGEPVYERTADKIYNLPSGTVTKETHPKERADGKILELACGYQGWLGAWLNFDNSGRHTDEEITEMMGAWREAHPAIVQFWWDLNDAAIMAVNKPGVLASVNESYILFQVVDEWLSMILPNGKRLWYFDPQLRSAMPSWHQPESKDACATGTCDCQPRMQVTYMAQKEGRWQRTYSYGGKWAENATQAVSREILEVAKVPVVEAGYDIVLSVYDEIVTEVDEDFGSPEELSEIMASAREPWFEDWPIRVTSWQGARYKK